MTLQKRIEMLFKDDILRSLEVHKPSLTEEELNQYVEWTKKMGQSGA
jgi:hypothetical protein